MSRWIWPILRWIPTNFSWVIQYISNFLIFSLPRILRIARKSHWRCLYARALADNRSTVRPQLDTHPATIYICTNFARLQWGIPCSLGMGAATHVDKFIMTLEYITSFDRNRTAFYNISIITEFCQNGIYRTQSYWVRITFGMSWPQEPNRSSGTIFWGWFSPGELCVLPVAL